MRQSRYYRMINIWWKLQNSSGRWAFSKIAFVIDTENMSHCVQSSSTNQTNLFLDHFRASHRHCWILAIVRRNMASAKRIHQMQNVNSSTN